MNYQYLKEFDDQYAVTSTGLVFSVKSQKYLTLTKNNKGYLVVTLYKDEKKKNCSVHRLVAQQFLENLENLPQVDHINGLKYDNRIENLRWVTRAVNQRNRSFDNTEFIETLPEDAYSFEQYNDHQFRGYYIDSEDKIYQKITDNRYKIMKKRSDVNVIQIRDEDNIQRSISIPKLHDLNQELRKLNYLQQELLEHNEALSTIDEDLEELNEDDI